MADSQLNVRVNLTAVDNVSPAARQAAQSVQSLNQGLKANEVQQGLTTPRREQSGLGGRMAGLAAEEGLRPLRNEQTGGLAARMRGTVIPDSEVRAMIPDNAVSLPSRMGSGPRGRSGLVGSGAPSEDGAGGSRGSASALKRFARPVIRHGLSAIGANVGGLGSLVGPVMSLGPAAGAAAVAVWGVSTAINKYNEYLTQQQKTLEEVSREQQISRSAVQGMTSGQAQGVTRSEIQRGLGSGEGVQLQQELLAAEGNSQRQNQILATYEARFRGLARREQSGQAALGRVEESPGDWRRPAWDRWRTPAIGLWQQRMARPGGVDLDQERMQLQRELLATNDSGMSSGARQRLLLARGVDRHMVEGMASRGELSGRMTEQRGQELAGLITQPFTHLQGMVATVQRMRERGFGSLREGGREGGVGGLSVGQTGDISSLHQAIQTASLHGEQQNWQQEMLESSRGLETSLTMILSTGIPFRVGH